jgi:Zn-dependent protease with chaperone function
VRFAVYLPLIVPVVAGLAARPLAERSAPRLATWLLTVTAVLLATASSAALALLMVTGLARIPVVAELAHLSAGVVAAGDPTALPVAVAAGLLLMIAAVAAVRMAWRRARTLAMAAKQAACLPGTGPLVVLQDPSPEAFTLPGRPGRIVVSTGMLATLDPGERQAMLAHERAHLRCHHYLFTAAAQLAATANPLLRPAATAITYTVERWADENAATTCGNRRLVAAAIGKAALATSTTSGTGPAAALARAGMLGIRGTRPGRSSRPPAQGSLRGAGPLPRRVAALLAAPVTTRPLAVYLTVALLVATGLCCLESANDLHALLKLAHHSQ